jgi:hypothetical protein
MKSSLLCKMTLKNRYEQYESNQIQDMCHQHFLSLFEQLVKLFVFREAKTKLALYSHSNKIEP